MKSDTVWSGEISVTEDVLVPEGVTLTIRPGTTVHVSSSDSTKTDPEYLSNLTEITVRGSLLVEGTDGSRVRFLRSAEDRPGGWAGIIVDGGTVALRSCVIQDADTGLYVIKGSATVKESIISGNRYGVVTHDNLSHVLLEKVEVKGNEYGVCSLNGAKIDDRGSTVEGNRKKDFFSSGAGNKGPLPKKYAAMEREKTRSYGDEVLLGDTVWRGSIEIKGLVRVPEGARLLIMPGAEVRFRRKDTNNAGFGESGLMIQGVIIAKGTAEEPIIFSSAEKKKRAGDWDSINIMNSDGAQNLIEFCQIEDAYRGLHFHFSNVAVKDSVIRNNLRGIQFQESEVEISRTQFYGNKSGLQARDSEIIFAANTVFNNYSGIYVFRSTSTIKDNRVMNNLREGMKIREGVPVAERNLIDGNRFGLMVADSVYGEYSSNVVSNNMESGFQLKGSDNIDIEGNFVEGNGISGITVQDSRAAIRGNHISVNGEKGVGIISFDGVISGNNIIDNGPCAIDLEGSMNVAAPMNWWGAANVESSVCDGNREPGRGKVEFKKQRESPMLYAWPLETVETNTIWRGNFKVSKTITVLPGAVLKIEPGSRVIFSAGTGLKISGRVTADGLRDTRIVFTSEERKAASDWDEILLDYASGSSFSECDFEYATWGLHSHFTNLTVKGCRFRQNYGGLRFRSGPMEIRNSVFRDNVIGIRDYRGNAVIAENVITGNEVGIFVREKGGGLKINRNNIFDNMLYGIRVGDFNDEDVDARGNWWGKAAPSDVIYDERLEPGIGKVIYKPYAEKPLELDVPKSDAK